MNTLREGSFTGERALYNSKNLTVVDSIFENGESPLKESSDIDILGCIFKWKYPLWYCKRVSVCDTTLLESARSGVWYTSDVSFVNCTIDAPKTFRRCQGVSIINTDMPRAQETLWSCCGVNIENSSVVGDYFGMNSSSVVASGLRLSGNYAFDGGEDIEIRNSRLISKDAFWNCKNVTVYDSVIIGEYLGWNSENVKFVGCTIESNQGLCYMKNVELVDCKLINTDLAFEYSTVNASIDSEVLSVKNPISGRIAAKKIKELIMDGSLVDTSATEIIEG